MRVFRAPRSVACVFVSAILGSLPLTEHGLQTRHVLANRAQPQRVLQRLGRAAKPQAKPLLLELRDARLDVVDRHFANFFSPHGHLASPSCVRASSRITNFVLIGILAAASPIAFSAMSFGTPSSSNITRPGFTTATQPSGEPLPLPMRVSAGFFVIGLSGKIRIQTLPPRLM